MPYSRQALTEDEVRRFVVEHCFVPSPARRIGAEVEWLTVPADGSHADFELVRACAEAAARPGASALTFEPGGQIELSSLPCDTVEETCARVAADTAGIVEALLPDGIRLAGIGLDPIRPERRVLFRPRYDAMEAFFAMDSPSGRTMMCSTVAIQVNLDAGETPEEIAWRWRTAHALGPVLAAAFADSPFYCSAPSAWRSARAATWFGIDATRTAACAGTDPIEEWTRYVLNARVMLVRVSDDEMMPMMRAMSFGEWMRDGHDVGYPTKEDLAYHLTTLFPPVRARGWLELRMIDMLPEPFWRVPIAVCAALLYDREAGVRATRAAEEAKGMWKQAARHGLAHPVLAGAARGVFAAAADALDTVGAGAEVEAAFREYVDRYVERGRTPADDRLDAWTAHDAPIPGETLAMLEAVWS